MQLYSKAGGRPWYNLAMKKRFGPTLDAPTPKEYVDQTRSQEVSKIIMYCRETFLNCILMSLSLDILFIGFGYNNECNKN